MISTIISASSGVVKSRNCMATKVNRNSSLFNLMDAIESENYYSDLELAAAIGKNLLERNKELELLLGSTQEYADEQIQKSQHLTRQLEDAREVNEARVKLMEQIERNHDQLSQSHAKLKRETQSIQEQNEALTETLQSLVEKCNEYKTEMESLRRENKQLQKQLSTTQNEFENVVVETKAVDESRMNSTVDCDIQDLSVAIKELKFEQDLEKTMREDLENELSQLIIENQNLEQRLRLFASSNRNSFAEESKELANSVDGSTNTEPDIEEDAECLNESFVMVEELGISEMDSEASIEKYDVSFLDELDQQYKELVMKYNALVEKCKSEGIPYESRDMHTVQRGVQTTQEELAGGAARECQEGYRNVATGYGDETVPGYKKMFAKLYEKIREGQKEV